MPFISYDIDITRTVFVDGSVTLQAVATATVGKLQHGDAANYYGWGAMTSQPIPHLAACGDVYAVGDADLMELFSIAKVSRAVTQCYLGSCETVCLSYFSARRP